MWKAVVLPFQSSHMPELALLIGLNVNASQSKLDWAWLQQLSGPPLTLLELSGVPP
jgi:hypothetical protein